MGMWGSLCDVSAPFSYYLVLNIVQVLSAKLSQANTNMASSPDSSSDSSTSSPQHPYDGPNVEAENSLPGVVSRDLIFLGKPLELKKKKIILYF